MKNENEFNAYLSRSFKKCPGYKAVKVSDRFKIGLPDFLIFHDGKAAVVECKFAAAWHENKNMLGHTVSKPQITALAGFNAVNVPGLVLIGIAENKKMYVGRPCHLTDSGNITGRLIDNHFFSFGFKEIPELLNHLFEAGT